MIDEYLLEAMREVDELTPACPPIAPDPHSQWVEVDQPIHEIANQIVLTKEEAWVSRHAGIGLRRYAEIKHAQLMQNARKP